MLGLWFGFAKVLGLGFAKVLGLGLVLVHCNCVCALVVKNRIHVYLEIMYVHLFSHSLVFLIVWICVNFTNLNYKVSVDENVNES